MTRLHGHDLRPALSYWLLRGVLGLGDGGGMARCNSRVWRDRGGSFELIRALFVSVAHPTLRIILASAFVAPAALIGYAIFDRLSAGSVPSEAWRQVLCALGAGLAGMLAFARLVAQDQD